MVKNKYQLKWSNNIYIVLFQNLAYAIHVGLFSDTIHRGARSYQSYYCEHDDKTFEDHLFWNSRVALFFFSDDQINTSVSTWESTECVR